MAALEQPAPGNERPRDERASVSMPPSGLEDASMPKLVGAQPADPARPEGDHGPAPRGQSRGKGRQKIEQVFKSIRFREQNSAEIAEVERAAVAISNSKDLDIIVSRLLAQRGGRVGSELDKFLEPSLGRDLPDKWQMKNLDKACDLVVEAIKKGQKVGVCCDYDVDGTSAAAIVLRCLGAVGVETKLLSPDRFESGYGLQRDMVNKVARDGCGLLIALDFGTSNPEELAHARQRGLKTLVVDHHHVPETACPADVFVNPKQPGCGFESGNISTAGLAWLLAAGVKERLAEGNQSLAAKSKKIDLDALSAYAALGLIADVVPLTGANRVMSRAGLAALSASESAGIKALKAVAGVSGEVLSEDVGFAIGPRINAAGRMARKDKHGVTGAMDVVELFTTEDPIRAQELAEKLNGYNVERKKVEKKVKQLAVDQLKKRAKLPSAIVVWGAEFHEGVNGIVASRLVEVYNRPAVVLGIGQDGRLKGSVRGVPGLHVVEALESVSHLLDKYGGHEGAGGLTVGKRKITEFVKAFEQECEKRLRGVDTTPIVRPDVETSLAEIKEVGPRLIEDLKRLEPYGTGNTFPKLLVRGAYVVSAVVQDERHLKLMLRQGNTYLNAMVWYQADHPALKPGMHVDIVCKPSIDKHPSFGTKDKLQVEVLAAQEVKH